jgi:chromatin remodeling complex protein RSC6
MKPVGISEALHKFLEGAKYEVNNNTKYARVDITRMIHSYVKDNNLRLETDKRVILPDAKLSALLNFDAKTSKDPMTYFRLPQYLKSHFIKTEETIVA